jgi:hypothetical protein
MPLPWRLPAEPIEPVSSALGLMNHPLDQVGARDTRTLFQDDTPTAKLVRQVPGHGRAGAAASRARNRHSTMTRGRWGQRDHFCRVLLARCIT